MGDGADRVDLAPQGSVLGIHCGLCAICMVST
jgi:hypothetical protein